MNKMERPMMTIVRFGAEDVIATSSPVNFSNPYSALGSEIQEYATNKSGYVDDSDHPVDALGANNLYDITFNNQGVLYIGYQSTDQFYYAWYNKTNGNWLTENRTAGTYGEISNLPK